MRGTVHTFRALMIPIAVGAIALAGVGIPSTVQAADEMKVEVTITDKGYEVKGYTTAGSLTKIDVRNKGTMTHGFVSPLFTTGILNTSGDGEEIKGGPKSKGVRGYHLDPGEHMILTFKQPSTTDPATGIRETTQVPFWCDIHTGMRGEFLVIETRGEVGGG